MADPTFHDRLRGGTVPAMTTRSPEQRARFVRAAASDLDIAPELAERLLFLSESARVQARTGAVDDGTVRGLLDSLLDDELCRHAWWVAGAEGEDLWRLLLQSARPPLDVGPAVLLGFSLARRGAADEALDLVGAVIRPGEFRRSAIELLADLAEDAGRPDQAWIQVERLGLAEPDAEWSALRCVLGCSQRRQCERSRLAGVMHARWLRERLSRWARRPWSGGALFPAEPLAQRGQRGGAPWRAAIADYIAVRRTVLPVGERQLLEQWAQARRSRVTVMQTSPWEGVILDDAGDCRVVGWETTASSSVPVGSALDCWVLPTLVPAEHLLVRWMVPTPW
jgi:hypothetical protein